MIVFLFGLGAVPVKAAAPTLADQLNMTLSTVNWSSPTSFIVPHFGLIFTHEGNYDAALSAIPDFKTLIQTKRIAELYATNGYNLPNFPDYILQDLDYKFISGGDWSAKLWSPGAYVVRHAESNPEKRLENTVTAWAAMHSYYGLMDDSMKSNFINLLTGSPNAWQGLINYSNMYGEGRFRWRENQNYTDDATCGGAMTLFLNGIVPDSGSLAIPVIDEVYQDWYSMFPASHFRFDYESKTIRIPVWAGKINFIFGTETASYVFPDNGIYEVHFSTDWNNVTNANKIISLSEQLVYLNPVVDNPPSSLPSPPPSPPPSSFSYSFPSSPPFPPPDTTSPTIVVVSPKNKTYSDKNISLPFTLSEPTLWISYSIDGRANVTISGKPTLSRLPDGSHSIVVYASDLAGNIGSSDIIHFTVDTSPPSISLLSPQNQTYNPADLLLNFTLNETATWIGYSLDGQETVTITGNTILTDLSYGSHAITVYATDPAGNTGTSETIHFSVPEPFPTAWTATAIAMIATGGVAFLFHFKRTNKATKKTER